MEFARRWLHAYWFWMTGGSLLRFAVGFGAPIAAFVLAVNMVQSNEGLPSDMAARSATPAVTAQVAGVVASPRGTAQAAQPVPTVAPTAARSVLTYVVKSGDSLGAICSAQAPSMGFNACVAAIVELNKLAGPDQLAVGQSLSLPAVSGTSGTALQPAPATSTREASTNSGTAASPTPRPAATTSTPPTGGAIKITWLSTPIKAGQSASLDASVAPATSCSLQYAAPSGTTSTAAGLVTKVSDASGHLTWSWEISGNTKKGKGTVIVTCGGTTLSAYIEIS